MELNGEQIACPNRHREGFTVFAGGIHRGRVIRLGIKRVYKVELISGLDMPENGVRLDYGDLVPAHMWDFEG